VAKGGQLQIEMEPGLDERRFTTLSGSLFTALRAYRNWWFRAGKKVLRSGLGRPCCAQMFSNPRLTMVAGPGPPRTRATVSVGGPRPVRRADYAGILSCSQGSDALMPSLWKKKTVLAKWPSRPVVSAAGREKKKALSQERTGVAGSAWLLRGASRTSVGG